MNFDASGSSDSDGTLAQFQWDLDGNYHYEQITTQPTATHTYYQPGTYAANVRIFDDDGAHSSAYTTISVSVGGPYWHVYSVNPSLTNAQQCSLAMVGGRPAIAYSERSSEKVYFVRANDANGTVWGNRVTVGDGGQWADGVSLAMVNGRPSVLYSDSKNAYIGDLYFSRASNSTGDNWPSRVKVAGGTTINIECRLAVVNGRPVALFGHTGGLNYVRATDANGTSWQSPVLPYAYGGGYPDIAIIEGHPAVIHGVQAGELIYQRSNDVDGLNWAPGPDSPAVVVASHGGNCSALEISGGRPVVAFHSYYGGDPSLRFSRAKDKYGTTWEQVQVLDSGSFNLGNSLDMSTVFGVPFICYAEHQPLAKLKCITASDGYGAAWSSPEEVTQAAIFWVSTASVNNWPAVAYIDGQGLKYAVKYQ